MHVRRWAAVAAAMGIVGSLLITSSGAAAKPAAAGAVPLSGPLVRGTSTAGTIVNVRALALSGSKATAAPIAHQRLPWKHIQTSASPRPRVVFPPPPDPAEATTNALPVANLLVRFDGMGNIGALEPPDPWVAVGATEVMQVVNESIRITDRVGGNVMTIGQNDFFKTSTATNPANRVHGGFNFGDARFIYDAFHQRWLGIAMRVDCQASTPTGYVDIARSDTADPRGTWNLRSLNYGQNLPDFPGLGTSTDKVGLGVNVFTLDGNNSSPLSCITGGGFGTFVGGTFTIMDWSAVLGTAAIPVFQPLSPSALVFSLRPAVQWPATSPTLLIAGEFDGIAAGSGPTHTDLVTLAITGTVAGGSAGVSVAHDLTMEGLAREFSATVPIPVQPGPDPVTGPTGVDERPTDAIWQAGQLWVVSNYGCTPTGDSAMRTCVRVTRIDNAEVAAPRGTRIAHAVGQDFYLDAVGDYLFMGGVGVDGNGTLHISYTQSGPSQAIIWRHVYRRATDPPNTVSAAIDVAGGTDNYGASRTRWGDYTGVAADPTNSDAVWVGDEFATPGGDWTTKVAQFLVPNMVVRLYGPDRYVTGVAISDNVFIPPVPTTQVFIATGTDFPDALSAGPIAGPLKAPVLLVPGTSIPLAVDRELRRIMPTDITIVGGTGAVSAGVATLLVGYVANPTHVHRIAGNNRYDTAAKVSHTFIAGTGHHVYVATGTNFPDALAGGPLAAKNGGPILLVTPTTIPTETKTELTSLAPIDITILGGPGAISDGVKTALAAYVGGDGTKVHRIWGTTRYDTAAKIAHDPTGWGGPVFAAFVATGTNFPDALAGGAVAGYATGPILLVTATTVPTETSTEFAELVPKIIGLFGGPGAVSDAVKTALQAFIVP